MTIQYAVAKELYDLGFTYHFYEERIHTGMVFHDGEIEFTIGGNSEDPITQEDRDRIKRSIWLPSEYHLMEWLKENDFCFGIVCQNGIYEVQCVDLFTKREYKTEFPMLDFALAKTIMKILKKKERQFDYYRREVISLIHENFSEE